MCADPLAAQEQDRTAHLNENGAIKTCLSEGRVLLTGPRPPSIPRDSECVSNPRGFWTGFPSPRSPQASPLFSSFNLTSPDRMTADAARSKPRHTEPQLKEASVHPRGVVNRRCLTLVFFFLPSPMQISFSVPHGLCYNPPYTSLSYSCGYLSCQAKS